MTQKAKILKVLSRGWTHMRTLNAICFRYSARIAELRREGHVIERRRDKSGAMSYRRLA